MTFSRTRLLYNNSTGNRTQDTGHRTQDTGHRTERDTTSRGTASRAARVEEVLSHKIPYFPPQNTSCTPPHTPPLRARALPLTHPALHYPRTTSLKLLPCIHHCPYPHIFTRYFVPLSSPLTAGNTTSVRSKATHDTPPPPSPSFFAQWRPSPPPQTSPSSP